MYFPQGQALSRNINLPGLGAAAPEAQDSQYTAAEAQLRANISRQYQDILQQLGYQNEQGQFIPGEVESQAQRQRSELTRNQGLAAEEVTNQAQREGTLFSGLRGQNQARAEHPFVQALADLGVDVPKQLNTLYEQATRTLGDYTIQNNLLLADAAARAAQRAMMASYMGGGGGGGVGGSPDDIAAQQAAQQGGPLWLAYGADPYGNPVQGAPSMASIDDYINAQAAAAQQPNRFQAGV
jgi:hypothetical protein